MILVIASGKGGTGKTTVAVNLAYALSDEMDNKIRLLDCDVEEPNDHLFVNPKLDHESSVTAEKPVLNESLCTGCGQCVDACQYNALALVKDSVMVFPELCHSCGVCSYVCPIDAFKDVPTEIGQVQWTEHGDFFFAQGLLKIGESLTPKVVKAVKEHIKFEEINILDAPPGTSCPVVAAASKADVALLVTEPTPFGVHDLELAAGVTLGKQIPTGIVINRSDGKDAIIEAFSKETGIPIIGRIPFKRDYAVAYSQGDILSRVYPEFKINMLTIYQQLLKLHENPGSYLFDEKPFLSGSEVPVSTRKGTATAFKEMTIISGKGGTGKTTVALSFAQLSKSIVLADSDVDASNLHLLLNPQVNEVKDFIGGLQAFIQSDQCVECGECANHCHFHAIHNGCPDPGMGTSYYVDPLACEGCGLCSLVCPENAITLSSVINGQLYVSSSAYGAMSHARLGIAEENSGKLVADVRQKATALARQFSVDQIVSDGPPGTGCPVIAAISGTDQVFIVTEPTVSGTHDLQRALQLTTHFGVAAHIIINKYDINKKEAARIACMGNEYGARVIGRIPFDPLVNQALMEGKTPVEFGRGPAYQAICDCWSGIQKDFL